MADSAGLFFRLRWLDRIRAGENRFLTSTPTAPRITLPDHLPNVYRPPPIPRSPGRVRQTPSSLSPPLAQPAPRRRLPPPAARRRPSPAQPNAPPPPPLIPHCPIRESHTAQRPPIRTSPPEPATAPRVCHLSRITNPLSPPPLPLASAPRAAPAAASAPGCPTGTTPCRPACSRSPAMHTSARPTPSTR